MDPAELRQRRGASSVPSAASSERLLQRKSKLAARPEWNDLQQDHSKFKLNDDEIRRRRESRAPRPLTSQPLLGDKHITAKRGRQEYKNTSIYGSNAAQILRTPQSSPHQNPTEYVIDDVEGSLILNEAIKVGNQVRSPVLNSEDYRESDSTKMNGHLIKQARDPCGHLAVLQAVLQRLNSITQRVDQLSERLMSTEEELSIVLDENSELKREVESLRREVRRQQEVSTGQEYVAMEEILERLKLT